MGGVGCSYNFTYVLNINKASGLCFLAVLIYTKMRCNASTAMPCAVSGPRFDQALGVVPASFRGISVNYKALRTHRQCQRTPFRQNRTMYRSIIKASAATAAPAQQLADRPMNIVFVSAEVRWMAFRAQAKSPGLPEILGLLHQ